MLDKGIFFPIWNLFEKSILSSVAPHSHPSDMVIYLREFRIGTLRFWSAVSIFFILWNVVLFGIVILFRFWGCYNLLQNKLIRTITVLQSFTTCCIFTKSYTQGSGVLLVSFHIVGCGTRWFSMPLSMVWVNVLRLTRLSFCESHYRKWKIKICQVYG